MRLERAQIETMAAALEGNTSIGFLDLTPQALGSLPQPSYLVEFTTDAAPLTYILKPNGEAVRL